MGLKSSNTFFQTLQIVGFIGQGLNASKRNDGKLQVWRVMYYSADMRQYSQSLMIEATTKLKWLGKYTLPQSHPFLLIYLFEMSVLLWKCGGELGWGTHLPGQTPGFCNWHKASEWAITQIRLPCKCEWRSSGKLVTGEMLYHTHHTAPVTSEVGSASLHWPTNFFRLWIWCFCIFSLVGYIVFPEYVLLVLVSSRTHVSK